MTMATGIHFLSVCCQQYWQESTGCIKQIDLESWNLHSNKVSSNLHANNQSQGQVRTIYKNCILLVFSKATCWMFAIFCMCLHTDDSCKMSHDLFMLYPKIALSKKSMATIVYWRAAYVLHRKLKSLLWVMFKIKLFSLGLLIKSLKCLVNWMMQCQGSLQQH